MAPPELDPAVIGSMLSGHYAETAAARRGEESVARFRRMMGEWARRLRETERAKQAGEDRAAVRQAEDRLYTDIDRELRDLRKNIIE